MSNSSGLYSGVWGGHRWEAEFCSIFNYPISNPPDKIRKIFKTHFENLAFIIPCSCAESYNIFITEGDTKITDSIFDSRMNLAQWFFNIHNAVNNKLGLFFDDTFEDICYRYNSFIAHESSTIEDKKLAYKMAYLCKAPLISYENALIFEKYAIIRGEHDYLKNISISNNIKKYSDDYFKKHKKARKLIKFIRLNQYESLEISGPYKNLPTIWQLKLFQLLSTTMHINKINSCISLVNSTTF